MVYNQNTLDLCIYGLHKDHIVYTRGETVCTMLVREGKWRNEREQEYMCRHMKVP